MLHSDVEKVDCRRRERHAMVRAQHKSPHLPVIELGRRDEGRIAAHIAGRFGHLGLLAGQHSVQQLADEPERIHDVVVTAGRKAQHLGPQGRIPGRAQRNVEPVTGDVAAKRLRPDRLVAARRKTRLRDIRLALALPALEKGPDTRRDLPLVRESPRDRVGECAITCPGILSWA